MNAVFDSKIVVYFTLIFFFFRSRTLARTLNTGFSLCIIKLFTSLDFDLIFDPFMSWTSTARVNLKSPKKNKRYDCEGVLPIFLIPMRNNNKKSNGSKKTFFFWYWIIRQVEQKNKKNRVRKQAENERLNFRI